MEEATTVDVSAGVVRANLARIKLVAFAAGALIHPQQRERVLRVLANRRAWGTDLPLVMIAAHDDGESDAAERFANEEGAAYGRVVHVRQGGHNETIGNAIRLFRRDFDARADPFTAKRKSLFLTRRGGKGKPSFVSPFTGGQGTTCGEWTPPMIRNPDGTVLKGFMKAAVAVGFCPVECPYCYLNMPYTDGMDVSINWEDLASELMAKWRGFKYPINFGETSGLVEYDEWFAGPGGHGSLVQWVIDACAAANVTPFFLTKIRYPRHLRFAGNVQTGISLMPEAVRKWVAPHGSPAEELLDSLAWTVRSGARDSVVRLTVIWQKREEYPSLLELCRDRLGRSGWRLTLDILRFTPTTASIIAKRYPEAAIAFAGELSAGMSGDLAALARASKRGGEHVKKIRPPAARQVEIFRWFRDQLNGLGCAGVMLTPCKGDPGELAPLARLKVINAMPCACYGTRPSGACTSTGGPVMETLA